MKRIHLTQIPAKPTPCPLRACVYNEDGLCDAPRVNHDNSDALCSTRTRKEVMNLLSEEDLMP